MAGQEYKPDWFNELHEAGLKALSYDWQSAELLKNKMAEYKDHAENVASSQQTKNMITVFKIYLML